MSDNAWAWWYATPSHHVLLTLTYLLRSFAVIRWSCWKLSNASEGIAIVEERKIKKFKAHHIGYLRNARSTPNEGLLYNSRICG